ncbi:MAG: LCP family protein [Clostridiales bacterium]|nr:LCP family protein [Clostridiales bacterium]
MRTKKKWISYVVIGLVAAILLTAVGLAVYYIVIGKKTLEQVTTPEEPKVVFSVYVLTEDSAESIQDTQGYPYGISSSDAQLEAMEETLSQLEETLGEVPALTTYENLFTLVDGLQAQESRAIILNEAYVQSIAEADGYAWVADGIRRIESFVLQDVEESNTAEEMEVPENIPESFVLYISGIDTFGGLAVRSRSDVNILMTVNTQSKEILMLATPRDYYVEFSRTEGSKDKLAHAGIFGVEASIDALERLYEIDIDYYLRLNFTGFVDIIDALGGVEVYSEHDFTVKNIRDYQKGYNQLTGLEALAFARERLSFPTGDYQRVKNQMEVIKAVITKCTSPAILKNYRSVMNAIGESFETNMPEDQILSLIRMQLFDNKDWSFSTFTVDGTSAFRPTYTAPGMNLYVILPSTDAVRQAREMMEKIRQPASA